MVIRYKTPVHSDDEGTNYRERLNVREEERNF